MNVRDLDENLRKHFTCIDGTPRNYMEIRVPLADGAVHIARFVYQTIGVCMRGEPEDIEPILCAWLWQRLANGFPKEQLEDRDVLILFRRWPQLAGYIDGEGYEATKLTMRLAIPCEDLQRIFGSAALQEGQLVYQL